MNKKVLMFVAFALILGGVSSAVSMRVNGAPLKGRAVWAGPRDAGLSESSVVAFAEQLAAANVNTVILEFKSIGGLNWPSRKFPEAVRQDYRSFDMPALLIRECHRRNIAVHAWFIDFAEGNDSFVVKEHPEWRALGPNGQPTSQEILRGRPYQMTWMCPAQRPGYTDRWLIPVIAEFVELYDIDAIHHDYVRYPGDLAPDTYCFCDYCLKHIPEYAYFQSPTFPEKTLLPPAFDRPHLEAHWESSHRILPANWDSYSRQMKSRFFLEGSSFPGGNHDLDHFYYEYRMHHVTEFVRQVHDVVKKIRPKVEVSAAVFKNPVQSGRFIGQDWRRFAPWVQYAMPMDYRGHFSGDHETYLALLAETVRLQKEWARDYRHLWIGVATGGIYEEEREPLRRLTRTVANEKASREEIRSAFQPVSDRIRQFHPALHETITKYLADGMYRADMLLKLEEFSRHPPRELAPPEKFLRTLQTVKDQEVEGIVIFSAGGIRSSGLWDTVGKFFADSK